MGLYSRFLFPRICDFFLNTPAVAELRRELLFRVGGEVLEIGIGTGLNLPQYPGHVRRITAVDPNPGMHRLAEKRIVETGIDVQKHVVSSERLPFEDQSFDSVVSTFTLCSIEDVQRAIAEVHRVLRPGGRFLFLEHGLSPDKRVQKWQRRLNWLERKLADNCHLDRPIRELVEAAAFESIEVREFYLARTPRTHGYMYRGVAKR